MLRPRRSTSCVVSIDLRIESAPLHRHQVGEVLEVGAPVAVAEEVVGRRHRRQVLPGVAQRHLDRPHVEVRAVVGGDDEAGVLRDVALRP